MPTRTSKKIIFMAAALGAGLLLTCVPAPAAGAGLRIEPGAVAYDASGFVHIAGTIHNETGRAVCSAEVEVTLETAAGERIGVSSIITATKEGLGRPPIDSVVADRFWLPAGEVAVFTYLRDTHKLGGQVPVRHRLKAVAGDCPGPVPTVAVEGFAATTDEVGSHRVTGWLRNVGSAPCRTPKIVLGLYGEDGTLLESTTVQPDETFQQKLPPGGKVRFLRPALQDPDTGKIVRYAAWGDCDYPE